MRPYTILRHFILPILLLISALSYAQANTNKIKTKWIVDKFETEVNTEQAIQARQELEGCFMSFGDKDLTVTRQTKNVDSLINKGPYSITGNIITLGKDQANILQLTDKQLIIQIPNQGILYLLKL